MSEQQNSYLCIRTHLSNMRRGLGSFLHEIRPEAQNKWLRESLALLPSLSKIPARRGNESTLPFPGERLSDWVREKILESTEGGVGPKKKLVLDLLVRPNLYENRALKRELSESESDLRPTRQVPLDVLLHRDRSPSEEERTTWREYGSIVMAAAEASGSGILFTWQELAPYEEQIRAAFLRGLSSRDSTDSLVIKRAFDHVLSFDDLVLDFEPKIQEQFELLLSPHLPTPGLHDPDSDFSESHEFMVRSRREEYRSPGCNRSGIEHHVKNEMEQSRNKTLLEKLLCFCETYSSLDFSPTLEWCENEIHRLVRQCFFDPLLTKPSDLLQAQRVVKAFACLDFSAEIRRAFALFLPNLKPKGLAKGDLDRALEIQKHLGRDLDFSSELAQCKTDCLDHHYLPGLVLLRVHFDCPFTQSELVKVEQAIHKTTEESLSGAGSLDASLVEALDCFRGAIDYSPYFLEKLEKRLNNVEGEDKAVADNHWRLFVRLALPIREYIDLGSLAQKYEPFIRKQALESGFSYTVLSAFELFSPYLDFSEELALKIQDVRQGIHQYLGGETPNKWAPSAAKSLCKIVAPVAKVQAVNLEAPIKNAFLSQIIPQPDTPFTLERALEIGGTFHHIDFSEEIMAGYESAMQASNILLAANIKLAFPHTQGLWNPSQTALVSAAFLDPEKRIYGARNVEPTFREEYRIYEAFRNEMDFESLIVEGLENTFHRGRGRDEQILNRVTRYYQIFFHALPFKRWENVIRTLFTSQAHPKSSSPSESEDFMVLGLDHLAVEIFNRMGAGIEMTSEVRSAYVSRLLNGNFEAAADIKALDPRLDFTDDRKTAFLSALETSHLEAATEMIERKLVPVQLADIQEEISARAPGIKKGFLKTQSPSEANKFIETYSFAVDFSPEIKLLFRRFLQEGKIDSAVELKFLSKSKDLFHFLESDFIETFSDGNAENSPIPSVVAQLVTDKSFEETLRNESITKHFVTSTELAYSLKQNPDLLKSHSSKSAEDARLVLFQSGTYLSAQDQSAFETLGEVFKDQPVVRFLGTKHSSYLHIAQGHLLQLHSLSGLSPKAFMGQILMQVAADSVRDYQNRWDSYDYLKSIIPNVKNVDEKLQEAREIGNPQADQLIAALENGGVFASWANLKKFYELTRLLAQKETYKRLGLFHTEGQVDHYNFFSRLAFHPGISMPDVFQYMDHPDEFLDLGDRDATEVHALKKPSHLTHFPHMDLTGLDLQKAQVEGVLDRLQFYPGFEVSYRLPPTNAWFMEKIVEAVGVRNPETLGKARNVNKTLGRLLTYCRKNHLSLPDLRAHPENLSPHHRSALEEIIFDSQYGLQDQRKTEEYRAQVYWKSDPEGFVAGSDTASCDAFGRGKRNVYTFNPACAQFVLQRKVEGQWRLITQSTLTPDIDIRQSIPEVLAAFKKTKGSMVDVLNHDLSEKPTIHTTADNIQMAPNYWGRTQFHTDIMAVYSDFFARYLDLVAPLYPDYEFDLEALKVGLSYTHLSNLKKEPNTVLPIIPPGYSDNVGEKVGRLELQKIDVPGAVVTEGSFEPRVSQQNLVRLDSKEGVVRSLIAFETVRVSFLEGKIYQENEALIQFVHRMGNEMIGKDILSEQKKRPHLSLIAENAQGRAEGYLLAYEGVTHKDLPHLVDRFGPSQRAIYVSDLAVKSENKEVGSRLIHTFLRQLERLYFQPGEALPLIAEFRKKTSYPMVQRLTDPSSFYSRMLKHKYGLEFEAQELESKDVGGEEVVRMALIPRPIAEPSRQSA